MTPPPSPMSPASNHGGASPSRRSGGSNNSSRSRAYYRRLKERMRKFSAGPLIVYGQAIPLLCFALFLPTLLFLDSDQPLTEEAKAGFPLKEDDVQQPKEDANSDPGLKSTHHVAPAPVKELLQSEDESSQCVGVPPVHVTLLLAFASGGLLDSRSFKRVMAMGI